MNIKRNIIFTPEERKKEGVTVLNNVPIRVRVTYNGSRVDFHTGYRIDVCKWDSDKQRGKNGCFNKIKQIANQIKTDILHYYTELQNVFKDYEAKDRYPHPRI